MTDKAIKTIKMHQALKKELGKYNLSLVMGRVFDQSGKFLTMIDWSNIDLNKSFNINNFPEVLPFLK